MPQVLLSQSVCFACLSPTRCCCAGGSLPAYLPEWAFHNTEEIVKSWGDMRTMSCMFLQPGTPGSAGLWFSGLIIWKKGKVPGISSYGRLVDRCDPIYCGSLKGCLAIGCIRILITSGVNGIKEKLITRFIPRPLNSSGSSSLLLCQDYWAVFFGK